MKPNLVSLPSSPGIYRFYDSDRVLMYIGKAKNLKKRVRSYFVKQAELSPAKQQMVSEIHDFDVIAVNSEKEALLLEAGLIKKNKPKYNIVLRDDKNWTYIVITKEIFPRILTGHGTKQFKGEYFGPYTSGKIARTIVRLLHRLLPLRTCKRDLSTLPKGLVCMQYHLGNCLGPCEKKIDSNEYDALIEKAKRILRGEGKVIIDELRKDMVSYSRSKHFEQAAILRDKIKAWESVYEPQNVVSHEQYNRDIIGIVRIDCQAVITVLQIRKGQIQDKLSYLIEDKLSLEKNELLEAFLLQYYAPPAVKPKELLVPLSLNSVVIKALSPLTILTPQRGAQKKFLEIAEKNALLYYHTATKTKPLPDSLYRIQETLDLTRLPRRIEAYDISNIQGTYAVGAMIVAVNGALKPSEYKRFRIKTITGSNDVAMMREVVSRRQQHPEWGEPDLLLLDGGKPQLNTVYPILSAAWKEKVASIAKREEELFVPGRAKSIRLPKSDPGLLLLKRIRDEVHRKAIGYYRLTHKKHWKD
jgi:excinuclease ABC subunit C